MNATQQKQIMSRRNFLKLFGAVGLSAIGISFLDMNQPWIDYDSKAKSSLRSYFEGIKMTEKQMEIIRYATLAANGHNTQPWQFSIEDKGIKILPNYDKSLAVVDPDHRELWISLGCALENLLITAQKFGFSTEVTYPDSNEFIDIYLEEDKPKHSELFDAIPSRQNTRSMYDGKSLKPIEFDQLQTLTLEPEIALHFANSPADFDLLADYINQGTLHQYSDKAFLRELIQWLRFNKKEALRSMDGLFSHCSGNPEVPRFIGQMFVDSTNPQQQAVADIKKLQSSSGAVVIASNSDSRTDWVRTGQVYERMALKMTLLNIKSALLNQPVEVKDIRPRFQQALGLGTCTPQLLIRFGFANAMPISLRRPVSDVLRIQ